MDETNGKHVVLLVGLIKALILVLCGIYLAFLAISAKPSKKGATPGYWRVAIFHQAVSSFSMILINEVIQWD